MADDLAECLIVRLRIVVSLLTPLLHIGKISGYLAVTIARWIQIKHPSTSDHQE